MKFLTPLAILFGMAVASAAPEEVPLLMPSEKAVLDQQKSELDEAVKPALATAAKSTVRIWSGAKRLAYGTVVGDGTKVISKWSEVSRGKEELSVAGAAPDKFWPAKIEGVYRDEDLVVLKIDGATLTPVSWSFDRPKLGAFLAAPQPDGNLAAFGVVSVLERSLRETDSAFLGVDADPQYTGKGVKIAGFIKGSGAQAAGLKAGDIIVKVNERPVSGLLALKNALVGSAPGENITLTANVDGTEKRVVVKLGNKPEMPQYLGERLEQMEHMGGALSQVRDSFTHAIQTDMSPNPNQIGGPVVDLQGRVLGITIARADRTRSFVMPAGPLVKLLGTSPVAPSKLQDKVDVAANSARPRIVPPAAPSDPQHGPGNGGGPGDQIDPLQQAQRLSRHVAEMQRLLDYMREEMRGIEER